MNFKYIFLFLFCWQMSFSFAQQALHAPFIPHQASGQFVQPALLARDTFRKVQLGITSDYGLLSREVALGKLPLQDNFLDDAEKTQLIEQSGEDNRLRLSLDYGAILNYRLKKFPLSLSYRKRASFYLRFNSPNTLGLVLNGNAPYEGQTITDDKISTRNLQYTELGIGTAYTFGKVHIGGRIKFALGKTLSGMDDLSYSLETKTYGTAIVLQSDYNWFSSENKGPDGWGLGIDLGLTYKPLPKWEVQLAVLDLGIMQWQGVRYDNKIDLYYEGTFVDGIGELNFTNSSEIFTIDTLRNQLIPDSTQGKFNYGLPGTAHAGLSYQLTKKSTVWMLVWLGFSQFSPNAGFPLLSAGYHREIGKYLKLGLNAYGGGLDKYGLGGLAQAHFSIGKKYRISLVYQLDRALGFIAPNTGTSISMQGGLNFGW